MRIPPQKEISPELRIGGDLIEFATRQSKHSPYRLLALSHPLGRPGPLRPFLTRI